MTKLGRFLIVALVGLGCEGMPVDELEDVDDRTQAFSLGTPILDGLCDGVAWPHTKCNYGGVEMHCCPKDHGMIGIHTGSNELLCARVPWAENGCYLDVYEQRYGMKACPLGYYVKGFHAGQNKMVCCRLPANPSWEYIQDYGSNEYRDMLHWNGSHCTSGWMQACNLGWPQPSYTYLVEGIHVGNTDLLCGR